jgi:hypothetical protein
MLELASSYEVFRCDGRSAAFCPVASTAAGQVQCNATAQPVTVRAGGAAELLGDGLLICSGGQTPSIGGTLPVVNIVVTLDVNSQRPCAPSEDNVPRLRP